MSSALYAALGAGLVAIGATVAIERLGGRLGGLMASLPSTIIPASIGFWLSADGIDTFRDALYAVPGGMFVSAGFLWCWRVLPPRLGQGGLERRLLTMVLVSLAAWVLCAALLVGAMRWQPWPMVYVGVTFFVAQLLGGVLACRVNPPSPKGQRAVGAMVLAMRGCLAAGAIGVSVWVASLGVPLLAGMASVFPAIFLTTMAGLWLSQGEAVQAGAVGPMILGSASVSAYSLLCAFTLPLWGTWLGASLAWLIAVVGISLPAWRWLARQGDMGQAREV